MSVKHTIIDIEPKYREFLDLNMRRAKSTPIIISFLALLKTFKITIKTLRWVDLRDKLFEIQDDAKRK